VDLSRFHRAVDEASLALKSSPSEPRLIRHLADATAALGVESGFYPDSRDDYAMLLEDAIALYESALRLSPDDGVTLNNLGVAQSDLGLHSAAVETLRRALKHIPLEPELFTTTGVWFAL
jgi:tetratricopeptide (TPR) repeat protein